jgi:hypothetical protein
MVLTTVLEIQSPLPISNRQKVFALREGDPNLAAVRIAEILNITRERVRQILKQAGLPTYIPKHYGYCALCGKDKPTSRITYCSPECKFKANRISFKCTFCGNSKTVRRSSYNTQIRRGYKHMYCSVECRQRGNWVFRDK